MKLTQRWLICGLLVAVTAGCGLRGPLTLPSKSDEVVIRGPGQTTAEPAKAPAESPAPARPKPQEERLPPPPLPGGGPGAASGG
jgi:predicted small lipoprotein YifL